MQNTPKTERPKRRIVHHATYKCGHCPLVFHHLMHLAQHGIVVHGLSIK